MRQNVVMVDSVAPGDEEVEVMDNVNHPSHYTEGKIECIEYIEDKLTPEEYRGYIKGNVLKYITREKHKNGDEDLKKAKWYLDRLVNRLGESE
jgi:hypothetical protein